MCPQQVGAGFSGSGFGGQTSGRGPGLAAMKILWDGLYDTAKGVQGIACNLQRDKISLPKKHSDPALTEHWVLRQWISKRGKTAAVPSCRGREVEHVPETESEGLLQSCPGIAATAKLWAAVGCYPCVPGTLSSLALPGIPQAWANTPREADDKPQTVVTPCRSPPWQALPTHSTASDVPLPLPNPTKRDLESDYFQPLVSGSTADAGQWPKAEADPKPKQNTRGCMSKGEKGKLPLQQQMQQIKSP